MNDSTLKPSELKLLLRNDGIKYYKWIGFLRDGKLLLETTINKRKVIGKILSTPSEELYIWPHLQHKNINGLLEVLCINDWTKILISPYVGNSIGTLIYDESFNKHPECFDRKKSYARDILSALSYMHQNSVFHFNLSDKNIAICPYTDKAVLCDFSYAITQEKVTKTELPPDRHYRPPEVQNGETFNSFPIDIWDCGILLLQIFTQHQLPWRGAVKDSLEFLEDIEILQKTNSGANLNREVTNDFKVFIQHLLSQDPAFRPSAEEALQLCFLQKVYNRLDDKARHFWESGNISDSVIEVDSFIDVENTSDIYADPDLLRLNWTKSEPNNKHREIQHTTLPGYVSSPLLRRNSDIKLTNSKNKIKHCSRFPEWEFDNELYLEDDLPYTIDIPYPESLVSNEEFSEYCSLEQIIPHIISMSGINLDVDSQNTHNSLVKKESHRNSELNIDKIRAEKWIDVPLQCYPQSLSLQCNMKSNNKRRKNKKKSRKESSDLPPKNSILQDFKRSSSPKMIDKRDLYTKPETDVVEENQFYLNSVGPRQRKKWYRNLCCGCRKKK